MSKKAKDELTEAQLNAMRQLDTETYKFMRYPAMGMRLESRGYVEGDLRGHSINYSNGTATFKRAYRLTQKGKDAIA